MRAAESGEAQKLGLDDPQKLRLTAQQPFVVAPKPTPLRWGGFQKLHDVMTHYQATLQVPRLPACTACSETIPGDCCTACLPRVLQSPAQVTCWRFLLGMFWAPCPVAD